MDKHPPLIYRDPYDPTRIALQVPTRFRKSIISD